MDSFGNQNDVFKEGSLGPLRAVFKVGYTAGLPDGIFSYQKPQFGFIWMA
jgi:hypothetical protein